MNNNKSVALDAFKPIGNNNNWLHVCQETGSHCPILLSERTYTGGDDGSLRQHSRVVLNKNLHVQ